MMYDELFLQGHHANLELSIDSDGLRIKIQTTADNLHFLKQDFPVSVSVLLDEKQISDLIEGLQIYEDNDDEEGF